MYGGIVSNTAAANTIVDFSVRGEPGLRTRLCNVVASYSAVPAGGSLVAKGLRSDRVYQFDIVLAGPTFIPSDEYGLGFDVGEDVEITLAAGGAAVVGKVSLVVWRSADVT